MKKRSRGFIAAVLATVLCFGSLGGQSVIARASENLIENGSFEDSGNLDAWNGGGHRGDAVITAEIADTPIGDERIKTYGKISGRTSNYQCFAQDVTGKVESGQVYTFSFYVMLDAEDYKDAPAEQRSVEISPHMRANGSDSYSTGVSGTVKQTLEPGVWTKFTGTFTPKWNGNLELIALRILEQGTNYGQGAGVKGTYYVTGVELCMQTAEPELIQTGIVDLKNTVVKKLADSEFVVGVSLTHTEITDVELMGLVTKHFNAVTIGNELKPDAMFGYTNNPVTKTVVFNGEELLVPEMDFSRAETILDYLYKWNEQNPKDIIKVRGHVLLWHSQTPDWFFHEGYNTANALVDAETMSKRLEWYIASVAEHFNGPESKYKDLFYAWDVVNEAVSDSSGTYRNDREKSMWWKVYQSNEFIIQAFRFANKYMPEHIDLYYNDYNEYVSSKVGGIAKLLKDVKNAEGTRIDGMGMQGHYQTGTNPSVTQFENAVRVYAGIVDKIQITEWDLAASSMYDGTEQTREAEYRRQANRYHSFYKSIQQLKAEGINFSGITFWGVIDPNSWLQKSSNVGGGADGTRKQVPLLFDGDYQAKPAFWAFADETRFQKLVNPTPTPAPTEAPKATKTPAPTSAVTQPEPEITEVPQADQVVQETGGINVAVPVIGVILVAAAVIAGFVIRKKK